MSSPLPEPPDPLLNLLRFLAAFGTLGVVAVAAQRGAASLCWAGIVINLCIVVRAWTQASLAARRARAAESQLVRGVADLQRIDSELRGQSRRLTDSNRLLAQLAATDGLTSLANRRHLDATLTRFVADANRDGAPLSVLLLDVDRFKAYNDAFGHPAGDRALRAVADLLRGAMRGSDLAGRYGGEEFLALLPGTDADQARLVAERLRSSIEGEVWAGRQVTVSLGVATLGPTVRGAAMLVEAADRALYISKRHGRNRVTHADDPPPAMTADHGDEVLLGALGDIPGSRVAEVALT